MKHDMDRIFRHGAELAERSVRRDRDIQAEDIMWALFCEAVETSRSLSGVPRLCLPRKSAWPDAPDEETYFARVMRLLKAGEPLDEAQGQRPRISPSAARMTRHDVIMALWHRHALRGMGDWKRQRAALWDYANGMRSAKVCRLYGLTRMGLTRLKRRAMADILNGVAKGRKMG